MTDNLICPNHIDDIYIKEYIETNGTTHKCKYCDETNLCMNVKDLAIYIEECISFEYDDPYARGAHYDNEAVYYEDSLG